MDKKSQLLFITSFFLMTLVVGLSYYKFLVRKDYIVKAQTDCDPTEEKCFIWQCDPQAQDESEQCTGNPEKDTWYYKIVSKKASQIPLCSSNDENCEPLVCGSEEKDCTEIFCDDSTKAAEGVDCSDPIQYRQDHPTSDDTSSDKTETNGDSADPLDASS